MDFVNSFLDVLDILKSVLLSVLLTFGYCPNNNDGGRFEAGQQQLTVCDGGANNDVLLHCIKPEQPMMHHQLTARQVFDEGLKFYDESKWRQSYELFHKAWQVYNETSTDKRSSSSHHDNNNNNNITEVKILDFLQYVAFRLGRLHEAHSLCQRALSQPNLDPKVRERISYWSAIYEEKLNKEKADLDEEQPSEDQIREAKEMAKLPKYNLCHDETADKIMANLSTRPELFCRVSNRNRHPLLILSPLKEEFVSLDPVVALFHDIILDSEVDALKLAALTELEWAGYTDGKTGEYGVNFVEGRKSKVARLANFTLPSLMKRMEAYSGLSPYDDGAEVFQIARYRTGGHLIPHFDTYVNSDGKVDGDRLATLLVYLSDVEQGGGTVFTDLQISIKPRARMGLFWHNFHKNETYDRRFVHGGCPVLLGEKWITTKWFRIRGQMLHNPCGLSEQVTHTLQDFDMPKSLQYVTRSENEFINPPT